LIRPQRAAEIELPIQQPIVIGRLRAAQLASFQKFWREGESPNATRLALKSAPRAYSYSTFQINQTLTIFALSARYHKRELLLRSGTVTNSCCRKGSDA
jgi:hypothetical protein